MTTAVERDRHVGMRSLVSPTQDWKRAAPGPWHWVVWLPTADGGGTWRVSGFAGSRWAAHSDVLDVTVHGFDTPEGYIFGSAKPERRAALNVAPPRPRAPPR